MPGCSQCQGPVDSPAAILRHNRQVAETGERSYRGWIPRLPVRTAEQEAADRLAELREHARILGDQRAR